MKSIPIPSMYNLVVTPTILTRSSSSRNESAFMLTKAVCQSKASYDHIDESPTMMQYIKHSFPIQVVSSLLVRPHATLHCSLVSFGPYILSQRLLRQPHEGLHGKRQKFQEFKSKVSSISSVGHRQSNCPALAPSTEVECRSGTCGSPRGMLEPRHLLVRCFGPVRTYSSSI